MREDKGGPAGKAAPGFLRRTGVRMGGWAYRRSGVRSIARSVAETGSSIRRLAGLLGRSRTPPRRETWEEAVDRLRRAPDFARMSPAELDAHFRELRHALKVRAWLALGLACAVFAWGLTLLATGAELADAVTALAALAASGVPGALAVRLAFRNWQVRSRRLGGFREWWRDGEAWWPR